MLEQLMCEGREGKGAGTWVLMALGWWRLQD